MSRSNRTRRSSSGFTLIELLVVIAVIGVLLALLLPRQQEERMIVNAEILAHLLGEIGTAVRKDGGAGGDSPRDLESVLEICLRDPDCDESRIAEGQVQGYLLYMEPGSSVVEAWPAFPGLTARDVLTLELTDGSLAVTAAPGAEEAAVAAADAILARAGELVAAAVGRLSEEPVDLARSLLDLPRVFDVDYSDGLFRDANGDGALDGTELYAADAGVIADAVTPEQRGIIAILVGFMAETLHIGAANEDPALWSAAPEPTGAEGYRALFGYPALRVLTQEYVTDVQAARQLDKRLEQAAEAAARGDASREQRVLEDYRTGVDAGVFDWITRNHAELLTLGAEVNAVD